MVMGKYKFWEMGKATTTEFFFLGNEKGNGKANRVAFASLLHTVDPCLQKSHF